MQASFMTYLEFAGENPDLYQLCFERPVPGFVPSAESLEISFSVLQRSYQRVAGYQRDMRTDLTAQQIVDLSIAMIHGITAMRLSNEPDLPVEQGRFGPLIEVILAMLEKSWAQPE
jgi:hypothetical protein